MTAWSQLVADQVDPPPSRMEQWLHDPVGWVDACVDFGTDGGLTPYQREILAAIPERGRVATRGPHGLGKTTSKALALLWFATTRDACGIDWKVPTTASAWRQLEHYLWPEIRKWARRLNWDELGREPFNARTELMQLNLKLTHGEAFAVASNDHEKIEGVHADHVLYLLDEAKAIPAATFDAVEGAFSGAGEDTDAEAYALAQSTPGEPSGRFYEIHQHRPGLEDWWTRHVTLTEAIDAGRVSRQWADQRALQWGERSALYANRVLGDFHSSDEDAIIPLSWVEAAQDRWVDAHPDCGRDTHIHHVCDLPPVSHLGVDPSRFGDDKTVLAHRHGPLISHLDKYQHTDTGQIAGAVEVVLRANTGCRAVIDMGGGWGAGAFDSLKTSYGSRLDGFQPSGKTSMKDRSGELEFTNTRSAAWWGLRDRLDPETDPEIMLPPDDLLTGDLTAPSWRMTAGGKIQVEKKDEIRARLGRSPDDGDAVVMAFWLQRSPVSVSTGRRGRTLPRVATRR